MLIRDDDAILAKQEPRAETLRRIGTLAVEAIEHRGLGFRQGHPNRHHRGRDPRGCIDQRSATLAVNGPRDVQPAPRHRLLGTRVGPATAGRGKEGKEETDRGARYHVARSWSSRCSG